MSSLPACIAHSRAALPLPRAASLFHIVSGNALCKPLDHGLQVVDSYGRDIERGEKTGKALGGSGNGQLERIEAAERKEVTLVKPLREPLSTMPVTYD